MMFGEEHQIIKGAERASDSTALAALLSSFQPQKTTLAHIRFATVGTVKPENCHPFTAADISGRVWTMIHNGTIYSGEQTYRYLSKQGGYTDSERLFLSLIDKINQRLIRGRLTERERFALISDFVSESSPRNKLNLMISDGELLYVHKNMKNTLSYILPSVPNPPISSYINEFSA